LVEKFKCNDEPEPQWIVEKLNVVGGKGDRDNIIFLYLTLLALNTN